MSFQVFSIRPDLSLPVYTGACIFLRQFRTAADLFHSLKFIGFKLAMIRSIEVNPVVQSLPFFVSQFHSMMSRLQYLDQRTHGSMIFIRIEHFNLRFRTLTVHIRMQIQVTDSETGELIYLPTCKVSQFIGTIVAGDTSTIQHRLYFQIKSERTYSTFRLRNFMGRHSRSFHTFRYRQLILVFVATYTRNSFSRHTGQPATHPLNGTSFRIQRLQ